MRGITCAQEEQVVINAFIQSVTQAAMHVSLGMKRRAEEEAEEEEES